MHVGQDKIRTREWPWDAVAGSLTPPGAGGFALPGVVGVVSSPSLSMAVSGDPPVSPHPTRLSLSSTWLLALPDFSCTSPDGNRPVWEEAGAVILLSVCPGAQPEEPSDGSSVWQLTPRPA